MDIELLASTLLSRLEHGFDHVLGQHISRMEVALSARQVPEGLTIVEDPVSVHPGYGIELLLFMGGKYNHFSCLQQAMGVQLASQNTTNFAIHMATGQGKSLVWLFPASIATHRTTILITPYPGLMQDIKDRCEDHLLDWEIWSPSNPHPEHTPILLVWTDQVAHPLLMAHVWHLKAANKVARVILDEPQALVTSQRYRPIRTQLTSLADMGIPFGLLSATLPSGIVPPLMGMLGIRNLHVVRGCTARPNLAYHRQVCESSADLRKGVVSLAKELILHMASGERGMVICVNDEDTTYFSHQLGAEMFTSDLSLEEQDLTIHRFRTKASGTIVCTTGLIQGIVIPHARWSIHAGLPHDVVDAIQSLRPMGRDGKESHCHLMALRSQCAEVQEEGDVLGVGAIRRIVSQPNLCVQEALTGFNDLHALSCGALHSALCDRCQALGMVRSQGGSFSVSDCHRPSVWVDLTTPFSKTQHLSPRSPSLRPGS